MQGPKKDNSEKQGNGFLVYTGIAFQMLATIGIFSFIGYKIDEHRASNELLFTAILGVLGVVASFIHLLRMLRKH
ncbi:MAG: AtpZ/AtpI family protein [Pedobacter sp.]|nr:MAG: AtpZ/AtpI family protein [Pedobacter sp.]